MWQFTLVHGLLIGVGGSASFGPLIADISLWFARRRGIAVAICSSGSYLAGTIWPLVIQPLRSRSGWRQHLSRHRRVLPRDDAAAAAGVAAPRGRAAGDARSRARGRPAPALPAGLTPNRLQLLLMLAGVSCCIAMAMPQVHIVAYCADLGYGAARRRARCCR